jgi:hypothetical protein
MPQETKSHPSSVEAELAPAALREQLEGWVPDLAGGDLDLRAALDKAFDYRGDVTITLRDGGSVEGYVFDRRTGASLAESVVRLIPKDGDEKLSIRYDEIAGLAFTGRDTAAGKSWETWVKKYQEKKAAGEKNIGIAPEKLD